MKTNYILIIPLVIVLLISMQRHYTYHEIKYGRGTIVACGISGTACTTEVNHIHEPKSLLDCGKDSYNEGNDSRGIIFVKNDVNYCKITFVAAYGADQSVVCDQQTETSDGSSKGAIETEMYAGKPKESLFLGTHPRKGDTIRYSCEVLPTNALQGR